MAGGSSNSGAKFTATIGLVVHAAVDGVALGAAATTTHTDVEMIVFIAIMLHKVYWLKNDITKKKFLSYLNIYCLVSYFDLNIIFLLLKVLIEKNSLIYDILPATSIFKR